MKMLFVALFFLAPLFAQADFEPEQSPPLYVKRIQPCNSWSYIRTADGRSGYVCSFRGSSEDLVDANSLTNVIRHLEGRIQQLEAKIQRLEQ